MKERKNILSNTTHPFTFQALLDYSKIDQSKMYYYFHTEYDPNDETSNIYDLFTTEPNEFDKYQEKQGDNYFDNANYICSFVKNSSTNEVLFVGIYERSGLAQKQKDKKGNDQFLSKLTKCDELSEWEGRLFFERPNVGQKHWVTAETIQNKNGLPILRITAPSSQIK